VLMQEPDIVTNVRDVGLLFCQGVTANELFLGTILLIDAN